MLLAKGGTMRDRIRHGSTLALVAWTLAGPAAAEPIEQHNATTLWFANWGALSAATLVVSTPDGRRLSVFAEQGTPVFDLPRGGAPDGVWRYTLSAATSERVTIANPVRDGRGDAHPNTQARPFAKSGWFTVSRGVIAPVDPVPEPEG